MASEAAIRKCRELGMNETLAEALDDMWNEMDADILKTKESSWRNRIAQVPPKDKVAGSSPAEDATKNV